MKEITITSEERDQIIQEIYCWDADVSTGKVLPGPAGFTPRGCSDWLAFKKKRGPPKMRGLMPRLLAIILLLLATPAGAQEKSMETLWRTPVGKLTPSERVAVYRDAFKKCFRKGVDDYDDHISDAKTVADFIVQRICLGELDDLVYYEAEAKYRTEALVRAQSHLDVMGRVLYRRAHPEKYGAPKK